uniref:Uncharacterized protein n=1 Tax=Eutreptiella gymnastica TaxID=73025 RepID=A0A6T2A7J9_9EUGL
MADASGKSDTGQRRVAFHFWLCHLNLLRWLQFRGGRMGPWRSTPHLSVFDLGACGLRTIGPSTSVQDHPPPHPRVRIGGAGGGPRAREGNNMVHPDRAPSPLAEFNAFLRNGLIPSGGWVAVVGWGPE